MAAPSNVWVECSQTRTGSRERGPVGARGAHQVINRSEGVLRYLMIGAHSTLDAIEYVDDSKVVVCSHAESLLQGESLFFWHELAATRTILNAIRSTSPSNSLLLGTGLD